jgi:hypothetical protein
VHRRHTVIENVDADLKAPARAHVPSGVFNANAAWLVCASSSSTNSGSRISAATFSSTSFYTTSVLPHAKIALSQAKPSATRARRPGRMSVNPSSAPVST